MEWRLEKIVMEKMERWGECFLEPCLRGREGEAAVGGEGHLLSQEEEWELWGFWEGIFVNFVDGVERRIGRTGRAGKSGLATAFFSEKNAPLAKDLVERMKQANQEIPTWLKEYAETTYMSANGRSKRSVGNIFAGYDYRSGDVDGGNGYFSSHYANSTTGSVYPFSAPDTSQFAPYDVPVGADVTGFSNNSFDAGSNSYGNDYGSVVATGWD
ncbi:unnamed protein product [Fraxinus pennsylvanica]|uniref:Uncharacterized protein n=1 Tax=Fraxinus pennsylvanica TaxID=56036 RepID=A0AAD1Z019_9LAMI|nr:unnamed protein product [Fraxinus pennsylvanica]